MASRTPASDSESYELALRNWRKVTIFCDNYHYDMKVVRRWFAKTFDIYIREYVMTFLDRDTAESIAEMELEIHHPELTKARGRQGRTEPEPIVGKID